MDEMLMLDNVLEASVRLTEAEEEFEETYNDFMTAGYALDHARSVLYGLTGLDCAYCDRDGGCK